MSAVVSGPGGGRGAASQDFELNLASVIDCFTVLIVFMLASAAFVSIGIMDAGVAAAGASASPTTPPPVQITVELKKGGLVRVKVTGKETRDVAVEPAQGARDFATVGAKLAELRAKWPAVEAATVTADSDVEYQEVIRTMETARRSFPAVLLGGF